MRLPDGRIRKLRRSSEDPGCAHELTFSCYRRLQLLGQDRTRRWLVDALAKARRKHNLEFWAYVIMPEHVHILFAPLDPGYRIRRILQSIKQPVSRRAINWLEQNNPSWLANLRADHGLAKPDRATRKPDYHFWQPGGGYDRNVNNAETAWSIVEYIHNNPVQRGLAERPTDWAWSSARWYVGEGEVILPMDACPPRP
jgi:putative transposase